MPERYLADAVHTDKAGQSGSRGALTLLVALCVGILVLAGCTAESTEPGLTDPDAAWQGGEVVNSDTPDSLPPGVKNIATWALPLDEFMPRFSNLDNYAEQLLLASCLDSKNIEWPVPWQDIEEPVSPVFNPVGRRVFNQEIAQKYGFRTNLEPSPSSLLWETFLMHQPTEPGFQDAFDGCLAGIRQQYPLPDMEDGMFAGGLAGQLRLEADLDSNVQEAAARWASCMELQGVGQLPENPNEFPSQDLQREIGALPPVESVQPSAREFEVAVAHATCLDSSGFSSRLYEKEWELQATAVEGERAKLDRIRDAIQAREITVQGIIAANAPKA